MTSGATSGIPGLLSGAGFHRSLNLTKSLEIVSNIISIKRQLISAILILLLCSSAGAESRLFLLRADVLHVLDSVEGTELYQQNLRVSGGEGHNLLFGTPGGKYVFVLNSSTGLGLAVDFENPSSTKPVDLSAAAPLSEAVFSPMGNVLYALNKLSGRVFSFSHKAGVLEPAESFILPGSSETGRGFALNSRGTRFYRSGPGGLIYYLASDRTELKRIADVSAELDWTMAPGGRFLWGSGDTGWTIIDESRSRVAERIPGKSAEPPVFDTKGRNAWALAEGGIMLVEFDVRRNRETGRIRLPDLFFGPAPSEDGSLWLAGSGGLYRVSDNGSVQWSAELPGSGHIDGFTSVALKPGQGFACF
jgi:hypothetical protein